MCKRDVTWQLLKCLKHLREPTKKLKSLWKIKRFEQQIHCPHHKTTHRMTTRRNVIHSSLLLLSSLVSLLSHPSVPCFTRKNYLNYFTINAANKSLWSLWKDSEVFLRDPRCALSEFLVKKKTLVGHHLWPPWCHVFLEPQRGSPNSSQYSFLHLSHDSILVFLPPWKIHPECPHPTLRVRLVVEITQSVFRPLDSVDEKLDTKLI